MNTIFGFLTEKNLSNRYKFGALFKFIKYYCNLQIGIRSGKIYHLLENQNPKVEVLLKQLDKHDFDLLDSLFNKQIKRFLEKTNLTSHIDSADKKGLAQIGYNNVYSKIPIPGFWTTGKATYYLPTKPGFAHKVVLEVFSIPPLQLTVEFENEIVKITRLAQLSTKRIEFYLSSEKVIDKISEISVTTDRLWCPNTVMTTEPIPLGVCVKTIQVFYS